MSVWTYFRSLGYANLLAAYAKDEISMDEVTLTFIRQEKPVKLMKIFQDHGFEMTEYEPGIYHVKKSGHIDMQIIVTGAVDKKYKWITKLTDKVELEDMVSLVDEVAKLSDVRDLLNVESVFDLMTKLNKDKEWMKGVIGMGAFRDLFQEEFDKKDQKITELSEQLQSQSEQLQSQSEQLQSQSEQLQSQNEQLKSKNEQLQSQNKQLKTKEQQLKNKEEENNKLKKELEQLKKQIKEQANKIAML